MIAKRITAKIKIDPSTGCHIWTAACRAGYPAIWQNGKHHKTSRVVYTITKGPIPHGQVVRHVCNNKLCVNAEHLIVGTQRENIQDSMDAGTFPRGSTQGSAKFSDREVRALRSFKWEGVLTLSELGEIFGAHPDTVSRILRGKTYKGV